MTHRILKSALAPPPVTFDQAKQAFGKLVDTFLHEMQAWHEHDIQVKALQPMRPQPKPSDNAAEEDPATAFWKDTAAWQAEKLARHEPYPKPIAHPDIVAAVGTKIGADDNITYVPDFEIVNDDPTPEQILAVKKAALLHAVCQAEAQALKAVQLPAGKQRAAQLLENDIRDKDAKLAIELAADAKAHAWKNIDIVAEVEKERDQKHTQHLADQESRRAKVDTIVRAAAQVMSDIEDLTTADVDSFTIPSLQSTGETECEANETPGQFQAV
jgi:hypothetical protein